MTRDERIEWIARHISGVRVSFNSEHVPGGHVETAEISAALHELVSLREEKDRNWRPPPPPAWLQWLRRKFRRESPSMSRVLTDPLFIGVGMRRDGAFAICITEDHSPIDAWPAISRSAAQELADCLAAAGIRSTLPESSE